MLISTYRRAAEPVLIAFGPHRSEDGGALACGLLFVRANLPPRKYHLFDPEHPEKMRDVRLPEELVGLPEDRCVRNATLPTGGSA